MAILPTMLHLPFVRIGEYRVRRMSGEDQVLAASFWNVALTSMWILVAVSALYWRIRIERIRAEEKAEERRNAQIASIVASMTQEIDQLRGQLSATDGRLRELDSGVQRAMGRLEGALEGLRRRK